MSGYVLQQCPNTYIVYSTMSEYVLIKNGLAMVFYTLLYRRKIQARFLIKNSMPYLE